MLHRQTELMSDFFLYGPGFATHHLLSPSFLIHSFTVESGSKVSQQPKKRILNIHDHDPCSTTSDPKEDLNVVLCLWLKEVLWILMELKPRI